MKAKQTRLWTSGVAAMAIGLSSAAYAQDTEGQDPAQSQTPQVDANAIVVTANKREQNLNDVGLSVTAIGSQALAERQITSVQDIAAAVPGLQFADSGAGTPIYTLRGIGFNEESLGVYPSVSVYTDEVPLPFPVLTLHAAFDLDRVEALKGPQGILFGQNATGGAINYIASKPTSTLQYGADVSYGRFNTLTGNAFVSAPIGEKAGVRLALSAQDSDGWQYSLTRPGDRNGAMKYIAGRLTFAVEPAPNVRLRATALAWQDKSEPQAAQLIAVRAQNPADTQAPLLTAPFGTTNPRSADWTVRSDYVTFTDVVNGDFSIKPLTTGDLSPRSNRKFIQGALRAEVDIADAVTLTSITSYLDYRQHLYSDKDGTALAIANIGDGLANIQSFNQEVRLSNLDPGRFNWVVGANYEDSHTFEDQYLTFANGSSSSPNTIFINTTGSEVIQDIRNYAVFANGEYELVDGLVAKVGGRYTNSRNQSDLCSKGNGDGLVSVLFNIIGGLSGNPFTPIGTNDCYVLNAQGVPGDRFLDTLAEDNFSWRVGLDYEPSPDTLFYANVSRGYKAGSYPTLASADYKAYFPVTQESVTSYEAGFKASLANRMVQFNGAAFYYDYVDKQIRGKVVDPIFDVLDVLINVPKSRVMGAEADLTVRPAEGLSFGASTTYLDSKVLTDNGSQFVGPTAYGNSCTVGGAPGPCDFTGSELPFTPKWSYGINVDYRRDLGAGKLILGADLRGQSSSVATLNGRTIEFRDLPNDRHASFVDKPFVIPSYIVVDARLGYEFSGGRFKVMAWGKNVFNEYYVTNAAHYLDTTVRFTGMPVTYGITLSVKN
ncbi:TonB-dependent receptor [Tsuneonella sp. YG55]|uniref:TonB-dependent receptor n=1 Tax=Tsuneonella litorea TaxID=2976475 RepID=A0A9X2VY90_9SPHN|nr:TonB-dependent receptor [Tsuneonella litorea]MCT2557510.1 TonB-dependent receptor [Tsuneonella litorea]